VRNLKEATLDEAGTDSRHAPFPNQAHLTKHSFPPTTTNKNKKILRFFSLMKSTHTRSLNCLDRETLDVLQQPCSCPTVGNESKSCKSRRQSIAALTTVRLGLYRSLFCMADDGVEHALCVRSTVFHDRALLA